MFRAGRRAECGEVDEFRAEGVDGFVEHVVEFDGRAQAVRRVKDTARGPAGDGYMKGFERK